MVPRLIYGMITGFREVIISTVDELISPIDRRWDVQLIKSLFWPADQNRILQIPIHAGREDLVSWHHNRNGLFTVKSAYHCQWAHKFGARNYPGMPGPSGSGSVWRRLWKLSIPSKIKIFAWRVLHGCIPCHVILANKHITNIVNCPVCRVEAEDIRHILFSCG